MQVSCSGGRSIGMAAGGLALLTRMIAAWKELLVVG